MGTLAVTSNVSEEIKAAGFEFAVVYKSEEQTDYVACFKNRFDAIMFMHANRIKEDHGIETSTIKRGDTAALQRKDTASVNI